MLGVDLSVSYFFLYTQFEYLIIGRSPEKLSGTLLLPSLGLQPEDGHKEMVRAVLESVAFGVKAMVDRIHDQVEVSNSVNEIR